MLTAEKNHAFYKVIMALMLAFFGSIAIMSTINIVSEYENALQAVLFIIGSLIFYMAISFLVLKIINQKVYFVFLILIAFALRFTWILINNTQPDSDYYVMYSAALSGAKGDFSFNTDPYFVTWAYQMGFTLYQTLILKLFGEGTFTLKLINCIISTGTTILIYKTASAVFTEKAGRIAGILYAFYLPAIIVNSVLTNQILASFLFYLALFLLLRSNEENTKNYVFTGVLFALSNIIRPLAPVMMLAFVLFELIRLISTKNKKLIFNTCVTLLSFSIVFFGTSGILTASKISPGGLGNKDTMWKFVTGFNYSTTGQYSDDDAAYVNSFELGQERDEHEIEIIKERTADLSKLGKLLLDKYNLMWGTTDSTVYWSVDANDIKLMTEIGETEQAYYIIAALTAFFAFIALFSRKNEKTYLFSMLFLIYMGAHLFIEIQTRYRDFILPSMFMFSGYGMYQCFGKLRDGKEQIL